MARIRTIKPEFPQSESIGRLSREARLLFILLWTFVDDSGKSRASSRMLASLLYPYDDDAPKKIDGWLGELELQGHILIYDAGGSRYLKVLKWDEHQKIDHPGKSRLPEPSSEILAKPRETLAKPPETLAPDLGPRTIGPRTKEDASLRSAAAGKSKSLLPDDWSPSPDHFGLAVKLGLARGSVEDGAAEMRAWSLGNGERRRDWDRVFDGWLRRNAKGGKYGVREDKSAVAAGRRLTELARSGQFTFGPRPSLLPAEGDGVVGLIQKGRSEQPGDLCRGDSGDIPRLPAGSGGSGG